MSVSCSCWPGARSSRCSASSTIFARCPKSKLATHALAAIATTLLADVTLGRLELPFYGWLGLSLLAIPVTLFWIVGVTNAYNFMDGINGMASIEAIVCGAAYAALTLRAGDSAGATLAFAIAGAAAGFLAWNAGACRRRGAPRP